MAYARAGAGSRAVRGSGTGDRELRFQDRLSQCGRYRAGGAVAGARLRRPGRLRARFRRRERAVVARRDAAHAGTGCRHLRGQGAGGGDAAGPLRSGPAGGADVLDRECLFAPMVARVRARELLLPLLTLPLWIPFIIAGGQAVQDAMGGGGSYNQALGLLVDFDILFVVLTSLAARFVLDD